MRAWDVGVQGGRLFLWILGFGCRGSGFDHRVSGVELMV